mgnify:CR=1 FL=1
MTDDFNEFFDDNTHWVEQGSEPMRGAEPPEPPKSRREMRKRRAQRRRKRISGIIIAIAIVALLIGGGYFGVTKLIDGHRGLSGTGLWRGRIHRERGPRRGGDRR